MKFACAISLGAVLAICAGTPASSAIVKTNPGTDRRVVIHISGQIELGDADVFVDALKQAIAAGKLIQTVQLNSGGGKLGEGAKLAAMIRLAKISSFALLQAGFEGMPDASDVLVQGWTKGARDSRSRSQRQCFAAGSVRKQCF